MAAFASGNLVQLNIFSCLDGSGISFFFGSERLVRPPRSRLPMIKMMKSSVTISHGPDNGDGTSKSVNVEDNSANNIKLNNSNDD